MANSVEPDEEAHYEPPYLDYIVCKFKFFHFLRIKSMNEVFTKCPVRMIACR